MKLILLAALLLPANAQISAIRPVGRVSVDLQKLDVHCYATIFGSHHDSCTGELLPLPAMRSIRLNWLEPKSYVDRRIAGLEKRIKALESDVSQLIRLLHTHPEARAK